MPGGRIIAIIFFVAVFLAGMTSLMNLYEAPIATVQEKTGLGRIPSCMVISVIGVVVSLLIQGIVSDWMDVLSIYICPLGAGLAGDHVLLDLRPELCGKPGQQRPRETIHEIFLPGV